MPELPEVETIVRRLKGLVVNKKINQIHTLHPKSFIGDPLLLSKIGVTNLTRKAKLIRFHLENNMNILVHLKMTGQLIFMDGVQKIGGGHPTADWVNDLPSKHTRIIMNFSDNSNLFFNDQRLFGWWRVLSDSEIALEHAKLGPDIIDSAVTVEYLHTIFSRRGTPIKQVIMDGSIVAGVGNIYACDALNLARIHPRRPAKSLSLAEVKTLLESTQAVILRGIELQGATIDDYVHVDGLSGSYQTAARVYGREGSPCLNCGAEIQKEKLGGRGTYFCPNCQK